jgi:phosphoribosylanthranilate isomerase
MNRTNTPRVKICCIQSLGEAWLAIDAGASALGLVARMPSGPGVISEREICHIARGIPPGIMTFLLTSERSTDAIIRQQRTCATSAIQIVDRLETGRHAELRAALPGIKIIQVIHITGEQSVTEARAVAEDVDALLLDSGNPAATKKQLGGTGRTHDWEISRMIRESVDIPVFLAGGLRPENLSAAIRKVAPFGVDVCNGVRSNGILDPGKLTAFFAQI